MFAAFDSACLSCSLLGHLSCDIGSASPSLQCAAVTSAYAASPPPATIYGSSHPYQLSPPRRRAPSAPRGDVLVAVTCHSIICLYDLAAISSGSFGVAENTNGILFPILKFSMGFKVLHPLPHARSPHR
jgi:hypothetical protein